MAELHEAQRRIGTENFGSDCFMIAPLSFFAHLPNSLFDILIDFLEVSQAIYAENNDLAMKSALAGSLRRYLTALRAKNATDATRYFHEVRMTVRQKPGVDNSPFVSFQDTHQGVYSHQEDSSS